MLALAITLLLVLLLTIGMPVGFALAVAGTVGLLVSGGADLVAGILTSTPLSSRHRSRRRTRSSS
jgi:C4-dicarboxylate transporter, DctM subunit